MGVMTLISLIWSIFIPCWDLIYHLRVYTAKDKIRDKSAAFIRVMLLGFPLLPAIICMAAFMIATNSNAISASEKPDFAFTYIATTVSGPVRGL